MRVWAWLTGIALLFAAINILRRDRYLKRNPLAPISRVAPTFDMMDLALAIIMPPIYILSCVIAVIEKE